jgi:hypothetical protein
VLHPLGLTVPFSVALLLALLLAALVVAAGIVQSVVSVAENTIAAPNNSRHNAPRIRFSLVIELNAPCFLSLTWYNLDFGAWMLLEIAKDVETFFLRFLQI